MGCDIQKILPGLSKVTLVVTKKRLTDYGGLAFLMAAAAEAWYRAPDCCRDTGLGRG
ncbi:MAG: hypothetical protein OXG25_13940 [Gammaproteobacteria bacterium]|nr:hypothetical protein [Gammaproteobacteria bacterium]